MKSIFLLLILTTSLSAPAKINIVTTLPDIAEVVQLIGGEEVSVQSLLKGREDAHYAEASPDFILKVNRADVVCSMGLDLEIGWLPKVLSKSGNAKVQDGAQGACTLGNAVKALDIPTGVIDRSLGDIHAHGNPHFNLSPEKLIESGVEIVRVLSQVAPDKNPLFLKNYVLFKEKMRALQAQGLKDIKKAKVMEYHKEFSYFFAAYGLESLGSLEEKPGMPPSAARIAQVAKIAREGRVAVLLAGPSAPHKILERFEELSGVPVKVLPSYISSSGNGVKSIEGLQNMLVKSIP